jgi:hypothetical protein
MDYAAERLAVNLSGCVKSFGDKHAPILLLLPWEERRWTGGDQESVHGIKLQQTERKEVGGGQHCESSVVHVEGGLCTSACVSAVASRQIAMRARTPLDTRVSEKR